MPGVRARRAAGERAWSCFTHGRAAGLQRPAAWPCAKVLLQHGTEPCEDVLRQQCCWSVARAARGLVAARRPTATRPAAARHRYPDIGALASASVFLYAGVGRSGSSSSSASSACCAALRAPFCRHTNPAWLLLGQRDDAIWHHIPPGGVAERCVWHMTRRR